MRTHHILMGGVTALAVALTATPASAVDDRASADEIASIIAEAAPKSERLASAASVGRSDTRFDTEATDVSIALDAKRTVSITHDEVSLDISLPEGLDVEDGVVAHDGTVVFQAAGDDAHAAVQTLEDGSVRLQTVLDSPNAPSTYTYDFGDDVELVLLDDGSVEVTESLGEGIAAVLGTVDAPWAVDANGADVPTHYTVDGAELTQHVTHGASDAYPITADPKYTSTWWNRTVYFNRQETGQVAAGATGVGYVANFFGVPGRVIASALGGYVVAFGIYLANGQCGKLVMYGASGAPIPQQYGGSEAGGYCQ